MHLLPAEWEDRKGIEVLRFAQDFACGLPFHFAALTPAKRLNLRSGKVVKA